MPLFNRLTALAVVLAMTGPLAPLPAKTKQGDRLLAQGRALEAKKDWDGALGFYEKALAEDPTDSLYQMAVLKARFQASQMYVDRGTKLRSEGKLGDALINFQRAYTIYPASPVAAQELVRTQEMIQRERRRVQETGKEAPPEERGLTPAEVARRETRERINRLLPIPELKPLSPEAVQNLSIRSQPVRTVFETIGTVAGINVIIDPDYQAPQRNIITVNFTNMSLEEALDHVATMTRSFWKPLSPNTIFVTNDNPNKRRDFADQVAKTFYLSNIVAPQELQEIVNALRTVCELQRVVAYQSQNAILVRGDVDQVLLAEKMLLDLDKPKGEVVVDILVMEANTLFSRQLAAAIASTGLNTGVIFTPRPGTKTVIDVDRDDDSTTIEETTTSTGINQIPLSNLGRLSSADYSITLPSAVLQAALTDTNTKVVQAPQLRSVDSAKASLKIGERQPTATGSFQPGIGGVGINPLVNTQFQYIDVGVNVEITPKIHDNGDVSMNVDLDISNVTGSANIGGIEQPIIGQRKVSHGVRMRDGEVSLLAGLLQTQENKQITGIPGLMRIPGLGKLFSGTSNDRGRSELMIALIPHVVRRQELTAENLRGIYAGTQASGVRLQMGPKPAEPSATKPPASAAVTPAAPPTAAPGAAKPPATAPPATAPPPPGTPVRVYFAQPQVETTLGSNVQVSLLLEGGTDVAAAPMRIQFDPKLMTMNDVVAGGFLSSDGQQLVFTKNILNESGTATIQLSRQPSTPGLSGAGTLVTLNFQVIGRGITTVSIPNLAVRNSQGAVITTVSPQVGVTIR